MGLTKRPFRAAFISAYNAGLMPFFLHFFNSAWVKPLVSKLLDFHSLLDTESCDVLPCDEPGKAASEGLPEEIVMVEFDEFVRELWSSEALFSTSRLSGVSNGSDVLFPFNLLIRDAVVDLFEPLPCVVVDIDRSELLAEDRRESSEGVLGSDTLLAGGVPGISPASESSSSPWPPSSNDRYCRLELELISVRILSVPSMEFSLEVSCVV
ncbi:hypothetical protein PMIN02_002013 [Paraphaeosphaeria minitans]